jgi:predicted PurR-regulated permease PerM
MSGSRVPSLHVPKGLGIAACLVIVIAGLRAASEVLIPIAFAVFLTVLLAPLVRSLRKLHIPTAIGIPLTVLACIAGLSLLFTVVGQSVNALLASAPKYEQRFDELTHTTVDFLRHHGIELSQKRLVSTLRSERALALFGQALSELATLLGHLLLVLLLVLFLLVDTVDLSERLRFSKRGTSVDIQRFSRVADEVKQYLVLKTYLCLLTGLVVWVVLTLTGIDFAPLWALLSVMLGYVPNIGPFIATAPPVLLSLLQVGPGRMFVVLALLSTVHMVIGNVIEPNVLGRKLGLSAFTVFVALIVWGWIWGPAGMLLSVPLMVVLKIMLENSPEYGYLAQFFEPRAPSLPPPPLPPKEASRQDEEKAGSKP